MTASPKDVAREIARGIRQSHLLNVALAGASGKLLREACDLAEEEMAETIATALEARDEEAAKIAANFYGGTAHTYASENADIYLAQDRACREIASAIRQRSGG